MTFVGKNGFGRRSELKLVLEKWQKILDAIRNTEMQKEIGKLDGYEIVCIDNGRTKAWYIKKNGSGYIKERNLGYEEY